VQFHFGEPGNIPVVANFNPDRPGDEIGTFRMLVPHRHGRHHRWNANGDAQWAFGRAGGIPVVMHECN
jgi:hypothetical protein